MLSRIISKSRRKKAVPDGIRLYAIGDVHGRRDLLDLMLEKIEGEETRLRKKVVFLGDYVDRGPSTKEVIDRLTRLRENPSIDWIFLKGNHEASMMQFLTEPARFESWLDWGGEETAASYGVEGAARRAPGDVARDLLGRMPKAHRDFLSGLALTHRAGDYLFVHAGLMPGVPIDEQSEEHLLWIRKRFHEAGGSEWPDITIVHGHHPIKKPRDAGWRIAVDTGAVWTGRLTAVVLEGASRRFISTLD